MDPEFRTAYAALNAQQRQAVDTIDGPVLVIAGPGTGKTQLLSLRVANILKHTDTDAGSILCLTFTNFAATNMRERLASLVGPSAHNVMVRTFHSFAAEVMNMYPDYFWNGASLQIAPDAFQLDIIQEILSGLPLDNPLALKFAGEYTAVSDVQQGLRLAKEAGLTPEKLQAMISVNEAYIDLIETSLVELLSPALSIKKLSALEAAIADLPDQPIDQAVTPLASLSTVIKESLAIAVAADEINGKTTETGKWKRRWLQTINGEKGMFDERKRNAWWSALAGVYGLYRDRLHQNGYYDYSDMIVEVITQLEQNPDLLADMQERFLYVLIDEFQDTNAAQLRLAHLVSGHDSTEGNPNLMAVGDDDQSIFAFNGAELSNMLAFRRTYPETKMVILSHNYRSTQPILDAATGIIGQADERLVNREPELRKQLKANSTMKKSRIEHLAYPTYQHQLSDIAKRIADRWQASDETVAVLARGHSSLRSLSSLLSRHNVPIRYEQQNNILEHPLVQQIYRIAQIAVAIQQGDESVVNHGVSRLLLHPAWNIDAVEVWKLAVKNQRDPHWLDSLEQHPDDKLKDLAAWLQGLAGQAGYEPLPVVLEYIIGLRAGVHYTSPLRQHFLLNQPVDNNYLTGLSALNLLRDNVKEFVRARGGQGTLADFVRFIHLHTSLDRPITDESWFVSGEKAVQLLTVHKAKGLEFDVVYIIDAIDDNWRPRHLGRKPPANLPLQPYGEQYDDYVRLLYVAATRARHSLIISSYALDDEGRQLLATPLINSLPLVKPETGDSEHAVEILEDHLKWPRLEMDSERDLLKQRLDNFQLSPTAWLQFLDVSRGGPGEFLERNLLRIPQLTTTSMAYGTAMHRALQTAQQLINDGSFNLKKVCAAYADSLGQQNITEEERQRYLPHGQQMLTSLFKDKGFKLEPGGQPELSLNAVSLGPAVVNGALDHVYLNDKSLLISDYKTGKPLTSFATRDRTKAPKAWRHNSQLLFYTLLARASGRFRNVSEIEAQIIYIEAEASAMTILIKPDKASLDRTEKLVIKVWEHIMDLNFPDVRHYTEDIEGIRNFEDDILSGRI